MATKKIILRAYNANSLEKTITIKRNFFKEIVEAIENSKSAFDRLRAISNIDADSESEFISTTKNLNNAIFCCFIKMKKGAAANLSKDLFAKKEFKIEDTSINVKDNFIGHIKDFTYFYLSNNLLILKGGSIRFTEIETYLNWLFQKNVENIKSLFKFEPKIDKDYDISNVKTIELNENTKISDTKTVSFYIKEIFENLKKELCDAEDLNLNPDDIVSATVSFKIKSNSKNRNVEEEKLAQNLIRYLQKDDNVFKDKNGTKIDFNKMQKTKFVNISATGEYPDFDELFNEMVKFASEIEK